MFFLLLLTPLLFNLTGLIDTYLTSRFSKEEDNGNISDSSGTLMIIGGIIALLVSGIAYIYLSDQVFSIINKHIYTLVLSGILYGFAARPYFQALKVEKIENIIPFLQTIPIFTYILGNIALGETLSHTSVLLMVLIVIVTGLFSRDFMGGRCRWEGFLWTGLSALLYSSSYISFKIGGGEAVSLWTTYFRSHIGVAIACLGFLFHKNIRTSTWQYFYNNGVGFSVLNISNEAFFIIGMLIQNSLILIYTTAYISTIISGLQPLFGFLMVYGAHKLLPHIYTRNYSRKELIYKFMLCGVSFVLLYLFYVLQ